LWQRRHPLEILDQVLVVRAETRRVVSRAEQTASFICEVTESEEPSYREIEWSKSPEKIASAAGVDDSLAQCFTVFERLHSHEKTTAHTFEPGRNHGHIPTPDGESDIHGASGDHAQDAVKNSLPNDFRAVAVSSRVQGGVIHRRGSKQPAIMDGREMLRVKGVRRIHVPIAIGHVAKSFSRDKIRWIGPENERQGKKGLGAVEEKDRAVALDDRIRS